MGRRPYTDEEMLESLRDLAARLGRTPRRPDVWSGRYCYWSFCRRFGSLDNACAAARLSVPPHGNAKPLLPEFVVRALYLDGGKTIEDAAADLGCSVERVSRSLQHHGVRVRRRAVAGQSHCHRGHVLSPDNVRTTYAGMPECKACRRERSRRYQEKKRQAASPA